MTRMFRGSIVPMLFVLGALGGFVLHAGAQHAGHGASAPVSPGLRRFTMEELHRSGGGPRGWGVTLAAPPAAPPPVGSGRGNARNPRPHQNPNSASSL